MSSKYAFTKSLKELRFHHCQTSGHSDAVRYVCPLNHPSPMSPSYLPLLAQAATLMCSGLAAPSSHAPTRP